MKLADVVAGLGVSWLAQAAVVIAGVGFLIVLITTFLRRNSGPFEEARQLPLAAEVVAAPLERAASETAPGIGRGDRASIPVRESPVRGRADEPGPREASRTAPDVTYARASNHG